MKIKAVSMGLLIIMGVMLSGCSMEWKEITAVNDENLNLMENKDYGQNLNPTDSLTKKFL